MTTRNLEWEPCWNVRDLGGLPTADGGATVWGRLVRADCLGKLTANGRRALLSLIHISEPTRPY